MQDIKFFNAFNQIPQMGAVRFHRLLRHFPSLEHAWSAPMAELQRAGLEPSVAEIVHSKRHGIDPDGEMEKLEKEKVTLVTIQDPLYPPLLKQIHNAPALLYVRGRIETLGEEYSIAIVGTRKISPYGKQVTPIIAGELAEAGISVVSGLALGVDELAHRTVVERHGKTAAILGSGLDDRSIYPSSNRVVARQIIESGGAVVSELPLYSPPLKIHFPYRNRIIAGLTLGTVVIEADIQSGALITARAALEYDRQVFAVPGSIFNRVSAGPNNLLKMGAKAVTCAADILEELNLELATKEMQARKILPSTPVEAKLLPMLSYEPTHVNKLIQDSQLSASEVTSALTMMEIKGKVRNLGAMQYVLAR